MNPRDVIAGAFDAIDTKPGVLNITDTDDYLPHADVVLAALARHGFVVVACPPGSRVVVDRTGQPCPECTYLGRRIRNEPQPDCSCGGSGVVEATTIHGLVQVGPIDEATWVSRTHYDEPLFGLVALPEETP